MSVFENGNPSPTDRTFGSSRNRVIVGRFDCVVRLRSGLDSPIHYRERERECVCVCGNYLTRALTNSHTCITKNNKLTVNNITTHTKTAPFTLMRNGYNIQKTTPFTLMRNSGALFQLCFMFSQPYTRQRFGIGSSHWNFLFMI